MIFVVPIFHPRDKYINVEEYSKAQMTLSAQVTSENPCSAPIVHFSRMRLLTLDCGVNVGM